MVTGSVAVLVLDCQLGEVPNSLYGQHMARVKLLRRMQSSVCAEQEEASVALMQSAGRRIA